MSTTNKKAASANSAPIEAKASVSTKAAKSNEPTLLPAEDDAFGAWNNGVKINNTWGKAQNTNAWLNVSGLGYKKIKDSNAQAFLALLMLGTHARDKNCNVNVRTESDGKIYELYVW